MRLLLTTDAIGGVWSFTETLALGLLTRGHAVAMISFGRLPSPAQCQTIRQLESAFAPSFSFVASNAPLEWMEGNDRTWMEGCDALLRIIDSFVPDVLHASQMCFGRLDATLPVLVTAHSDVLSWAESTLLPRGVHQLADTVSPSWLRTYKALVKQGLDEAATVVAPTLWMAKALAHSFKLQHLPDVIPNGVSPTVPGNLPRKLQAVTAGRLWDLGKGLSILDGIEFPLPFLLAGENAPGHEPAQIGVQRLGVLSQQDLLALFEQSSIYVATSLYEPFGLAPVEAAIHGCAIVARDLPSFREVWGDAALYFSSTASLQHILNSLACNPRRLQGARCRAHQRAARYTAKAMTESYLALYRQVAAKVRPSQERMLTHA